MNHPRTSVHHQPKSRASEVILDSVDGPSSTRLYLTEGPVRIISVSYHPPPLFGFHNNTPPPQGIHSHERFFFLFDDMLVVAKPIRKQK